MQKPHEQMLSTTSVLSSWDATAPDFLLRGPRSISELLISTAATSVASDRYPNWMQSRLVVGTDGGKRARPDRPSTNEGVK